jgi:hypothetical protein
LEEPGAGARPTDFDAAVESRDLQLHALEAAMIAECKEKEVLVRRLEDAAQERVALQNAIRSFLMEQDNVWSRRYGCAPPTLSLSEVSDSPRAQLGGANSGGGGGVGRKSCVRDSPPLFGTLSLTGQRGGD